MKNNLQNLNDITDSREFLATKSSSGIITFIYLLLIILLSTITWSYYSEIDDYVKANGIVRPNERVSTIQNAIAGKVTNLYFEEGKKVKAGDILYTIDYTEIALEKENISKELDKSTQDYDNLNNLRKSIIDGQNYISSHDLYFYSRLMEHISYIKQLEKNISEKEDNYNMTEKLYNADASPEKDVKNAKYQLDAAKLELEKNKLDFLSQTENEIKKIEQNINKLKKQLKQIDTKINYAIVKAPIDGIINVNTEVNLGDYIAAQTNILTIVPENNSQYKIYIYINNKDIAHIKEGQTIKYNFMALPYREYGDLTGTITTISTDVKNIQNGSYYVVEAISENRHLYSYKGNKAKLKVGMNCEARVIIGSKTVMNYLLEKIDLR